MTELRDRDVAGAASVDAAELATRYGLTRAGARPPLLQYARDLWSRRHFVVSYTRSSNAVMYSNAFLGQIWQILTPLLNAAVYYLIFGVLLATRRGTHNYIAFLVIGIFVFTYMQNAILQGSRSMIANLNLIRALHFPRATLPLGTTAIALQQLLVSLVALIPIVLVTGEPLTWRWLIVLPVVVLESFFCLGAAFIMARIGSVVPDTSQLLPFLLRTWLYLSGIFYSITTFTKHHGHWVKVILELNPGAVYPELVREYLLSQHTLAPHAWTAGVLWAVVTFVVGLVYFWRGEETYGRG